MLLKVFLMSSIFIGATAFADSQELSRAETDAIGILVKNLPELTIKNQGGTEQREFPAAKAFAASIAKASRVSANCRYRGKSLIEDCHVLITEGAGGEGRSILRSFSFSVIQGELTSKSIEMVGAL